jgi:hypothetical protein
LFCPQCRVEYREGFTECSDCRVPLTDRLPEPETPEEAGDLDLLIRTGCGSPIAIGLAKSLLEEAGIPFFSMDQNPAARQEAGNFLGWWDVRVPRGRAGRSDVLQPVGFFCPPRRISRAAAAWQRLLLYCSVLPPVRALCCRDELSWRGPLSCRVGFRADVVFVAPAILPPVFFGCGYAALCDRPSPFVFCCVSSGRPSDRPQKRSSVPPSRYPWRLDSAPVPATPPTPSSAQYPNAVSDARPSDRCARFFRR